MTLQHMIEHLTFVVQPSNGEIVFNECMNSEERYHGLKDFF